MDLKEAQITDLGQVKKLVVTKDNTTMIGGSGDKAAVEERSNEIAGADRKHKE